MKQSKAEILLLTAGFCSSVHTLAGRSKPLNTGKFMRKTSNAKNYVTNTTPDWRSKIEKLVFTPCANYPAQVKTLM